MRYDVICPLCGKENRNLYLEETEGWMECERCANAVQMLKHPHLIRVPEMNGHQKLLSLLRVQQEAAG